mgnify:CR=1 FL=1
MSVTGAHVLMNLVFRRTSDLAAQMVRGAWSVILGETIAVVCSATAAVRSSTTAPLMSVRGDKRRTGGARSVGLVVMIAIARYQLTTRRQGEVLGVGAAPLLVVVSITAAQGSQTPPHDAATTAARGVTRSRSVRCQPACYGACVFVANIPGTTLVGAQRYEPRRTVGVTAPRHARVRPPSHTQKVLPARQHRLEVHATLNLVLALAQHQERTHPLQLRVLTLRLPLARCPPLLQPRRRSGNDQQTLLQSLLPQRSVRGKTNRSPTKAQARAPRHLPRLKILTCQLTSARSALRR